MLGLGVIEELHSDWASPIVLVPKTDGSVRFCVDHRKVNAVSKFYAYPMPRVDELLDWLASARFYSDTGFNKRVFADPLVAIIQVKNVLHNDVWSTPICHPSVWVIQGSRHLSVSHGQDSPAPLCVHRCLDDIIIHSNDWQRHMEHLRTVLRSLRVARLTANPRKCAIGWVELQYLGFHLGHGQVHPQIDKTAVIAACPSPKTKKEVRQFLGLA